MGEGKGMEDEWRKVRGGGGWVEEDKGGGGKAEVWDG